MFTVCSVPSHHLRSTVGTEIAFCLEETVSRQKHATGDLYPSLLLHSQSISTSGQRQKSCCPPSPDLLVMRKEQRIALPKSSLYNLTSQMVLFNAECQFNASKRIWLNFTEVYFFLFSFFFLISEAEDHRNWWKTKMLLRQRVSFVDPFKISLSAIIHYLYIEF